MLRVVFLLGYLVTLGTGIATLTNPPTTIEGALGPILSVSWSIFWIVGGAVGAVTVLPGYWQAERAAVAAAMFGIGIYAVVVLTLHFQSSGSRLTQLGVLIVALLFYVVRLLLIRGHDFEPRR
ncbi:hypothetical protein A9Z40_03185 [Microbacterium arborescens]|uniref:Uncharacterized protein n=1 Tax=Microbacterium arborescens TaxID=33883 RepID=A0ABX2WIM6_9MICO|nr:hypothetical protein A9Z40_03185 [Microbacterium arborescens]